MNKVHILLVEDNEGDILLTQEAFEERKIVNKLSVVKNGKDALDFVYKRAKFTQVNRPDIILLDINIPIKSGLEVLKDLKSNESTKSIPIIMLTTSTSQKDIDDAYKNYANSYISKPLDMIDFLEVILKIEDFWLKLVKLSK